MDFAPLVIKIYSKDAVKALSDLGVTAEKVEKAIDKMSNGATQGAKKAKTEFEKFSDSVNKVSTKLNTFSKNMNRYVTLPLIAAGAASVKMSTDLNKGMASVGTLIPQQTAKLMEYKESIKDLAIETGKSFKDLTRGLYETISAFPGTESAIEVTELAAKTARAGLSTTKEALSLLSATTKAYGDTSLEAQQKVADLAFIAIKLGQTTFPEMASAIQKVTERSAALGVTQEELFSVFGSFTGVTGDAEMAATQMRSALIAISKPTQELKKVLESLGFVGTNAAKNLIAKDGLQGAFKKIIDTSNQMGFSLQDVFRRIEGVTFAGQLTGKLAKKFQELEEAVKDSSFAMIEAYRQQTEGANETGFAMEQAFRAGQVALTELGDVIAPMVLDVSQKIVELSQAFSNLDSGTKEFIVGLGGTAVAFGLLLTVAAKLTKLFGALLLLVPKLELAFLELATNPAIAGLLGPLGALAAAAAVGGIITFVIKNEIEKQSVGNITSGMDNEQGEIYTERLGEEVIINFFRDFDKAYKDSTLKITGGEAVGGMMSPTIIEESDLTLTQASSILDELTQKYDLTLSVTRDILLANDNLTNKQKEQIKNAADLRVGYKDLVGDAQAAANKLLEQEEDRKKGIESAIELQRTAMKDFEQRTEDMQAKGQITEKEKLRMQLEYYNKLRDGLISIASDMDLTDEQDAWLLALNRFVNTTKDELGKFGGVNKKVTDEVTYAWEQAVEVYEASMGRLPDAVNLGLITPLDAVQKEIKATQDLMMTGLQLKAPTEDLDAYKKKLEELNRTFVETQKASHSVELREFYRNRELGLSQFEIELLPKTEIFDLRIEQIKAELDALYKSYADIKPIGSFVSAEDLEKLGQTTEQIKKLKDELKQIKVEDVWESIQLEALQTTLQTLSSSIGVYGKEVGKAARASEGATARMEEMSVAAHSLVSSLLEMIPALMMSAGLQLLTTLDPASVALGVALIAGSLAAEAGMGYMQGLQEEAIEENEDSTSSYAKGGAFTNKIIDTPTTFSFAKGTGLMGEAGGEAIVPLGRTKDGSLGIKSTGGGTEVIVNVINNTDSAEVTRTERTTSIGKEIDIIIGSKVRDVLSSGKADGVMKSRYGVTRRGY